MDSVQEMLPSRSALTLLQLVLWNLRQLGKPGLTDDHIAPALLLRGPVSLAQLHPELVVPVVPWPLVE